MHIIQSDIFLIGNWYLKYLGHVSEESVGLFHLTSLVSGECIETLLWRQWRLVGKFEAWCIWHGYFCRGAGQHPVTSEICKQWGRDSIVMAACGWTHFFWPVDIRILWIKEIYISGFYSFIYLCSLQLMLHVKDWGTQTLPLVTGWTYLSMVSALCIVLGWYS